jgi:hypothetical protein
VPLILTTEETVLKVASPCKDSADKSFEKAIRKMKDNADMNAVLSIKTRSGTLVIPMWLLLAAR